MEVFTWFSVIAFVFYGVIEIDDKYGDSCLRLRISCKLIGWSILLMPKDWRTKKAINNLIATNMIENTIK